MNVYCITVYNFIDGHHKLIRWRLVTHGAIDGYSRLILYLKCGANNRASTVYELFLKAIQNYGLPSRIRCDQGGENIKVAQHMLRHRGIDRRSVIVGSSVHNQRIERLWRDMHRCVCSLYYRLFYFLEHNEILDPINDVHLYALHYVYVPRINHSLKQFVDAWNSHGIRTVRGQTPNQLFISGSIQLRNEGLTALDFFESVNELYGVENNVMVNSDDEDDDEGVEIPSVNISLSNEQIGQLQSTVNPLATSPEFGIDLFMQTLELLHTFITS